MARSRHKAFTLVELLVVIVILGLLMALLVPSLRGVWSRYNMTRCQSNLFHIYQAFRLRAADEAMGVAQAYPVAAWTTVLQPYLENDASQFKCTETSEESTSKPITEFVWIRSQLSGNTWYTELEPGPWMLKLSVTQYNTARGMKLLSDDDAANYIDTLHPEFATYVPDGQPHIYWLCMEDESPDRDFKDIMTRVTDNRDGTVTLETIAGYTNRVNTLMSKITGEEYYKAGDGQGSGQYNFSTGRTKTLEVGLVAESSYGMNEYAIDKVDTNGKFIRGVGSAGGKILVMDYPRLEAKTTDIWTDRIFDLDQNGVPLFARHFGQANVLFSDGSVRPELVDTINPPPEDINPFKPTTAMKWWMP